MLLAIDAGNSKISFAVFEGQKLCRQWDTLTHLKLTLEEFGAWLHASMEAHQVDPNAVTGSIISCVVPEALELLQNLCRAYVNSEPLVIGAPDVALDLEVNTDRPEEVGADLKVDAIASKLLLKPPFLILNMGTATTLSLVDGKGVFAGVAIAPGMKVALDALSNCAAQLPAAPLKRPERVMGTSTVPCMQAGIYWGYIGLVERLITQARIEYAKLDAKAHLPVIASGGFASLISEDTKCFDIIDPDLTLKGLETIYRQNMRSVECVSLTAPS